MPALSPALLFLPSHYFDLSCDMHKDGLIGASKVFGGGYEAVRTKKKQRAYRVQTWTRCSHFLTP